MRFSRRSLLAAALATSLPALFATPAALAQNTGTVRVTTWNVTNYSGADTRDAAFRNALYGTFQGRTFAPDILLGQEFETQAGVTAFVSLLNAGLAGATGQSGDWAAATFVNGPDTDNAFFYRTSKVQLLGQTIVSRGATGTDLGSPDLPPRDTNRYDVRILGDASATPLSLYSSHMASQSNPSSRRLVEAQRIRADAQGLPAGAAFLLGGDFNITNSGSTEYQALVGSQANNAGRFFDPIATPGNWQGDSAFQFVHTQAPGLPPPNGNTGGMDDRFDQLLLSGNLGDGVGLDYLGAFGTPYSRSTWNDPNHSYRAWGNDGGSFDQVLRTTGNEMVGESIAQSLRQTATGGGHLPVFLDLRFTTAAVPEPGTLGLLALAGVPAAFALRRRRK